jgi:transposase-like protein
MMAATTCINEDCPSDTADVEIVYKGNYMTGVSYTCKVCSTTWLEDIE